MISKTSEFGHWHFLAFNFYFFFQMKAIFGAKKRHAARVKSKQQQPMSRASLLSIHQKRHRKQGRMAKAAFKVIYASRSLGAVDFRGEADCSVHY